MLDKTFDPAAAEPRLYDAWEKAGAFQPSDSPEGFSIVIPPPNVTGSLHIGHALNNTLQDVLIRFKRMQGKAALWLPGTDHAGMPPRWWSSASWPSSRSISSTPSAA